MISQLLITARIQRGRLISKPCKPCLQSSWRLRFIAVWWWIPHWL